MEPHEINALVEQYADKEGLGSTVESWFGTQYDDTSAKINYSLVRHFKPKVVVEFGTRTGRCTNDILKALLKNEQPFVFKPYELENDKRVYAQNKIDEIFKDKTVKIGGDIMKATDIPDNIDYLFVDNFHDVDTTLWVFDTLLKKCVKGCLVQIHDICLTGDFEPMTSTFPEQDMIIDMHKNGTLPLEKFFWSSENNGSASSWWILK